MLPPTRISSCSFEFRNIPYIRTRSGLRPTGISRKDRRRLSVVTVVFSAPGLPLGRMIPCTPDTPGLTQVESCQRGHVLKSPINVASRSDCSGCDLLIARVHRFQGTLDG